MLKNKVLQLVSIVTPSFNQGAFIEETIQSVISQDYPNIEYIIMDGGSTDDTLSIIKKYQDRISKWASAPDHGQSDAINKGWRMASGDILAWLNSDDLYEPGAVRAAVSALSNYPEAGMAYGEAYIVDITGNIFSKTSSKRKRGYKRGTPVEHDTRQPSVFITRKAFLKTGFLNEDLNYCMDYEYYMRIIRQFDAVYIPRVLSRMRVYVGTKSSQNIPRNMDEKVRVLKKYHPQWYLSGYWHRYIIRKYVWAHLPRWLQTALRRVRKSNFDRVLLENES